MDRFDKLLTVYITCAFLTFGYSYNADYRESTSPLVQTVEINTVGAIFSATFWPLYWCVQLFKPLRREG